MTKKILLTGSRGFIGSNLRKKLENCGYEVIPYTKDDFNCNRGVVYYDQQLFAIIHAGAELKYEKSMFESNVEYTQSIIRCAALHKCKLIYIGSSSEYGAINDIRNESMSCNPVDYYGFTKYIGTQLVIDASKRLNLDACVIRPFSVYGPGEQNHKFIPQLYDSFIENKEFTIYNGAHDWVYIDDFVRGVILTLEYVHVKGEIINLGSGISITNFNVVTTFEEAAGSKVNFKLKSEKYHKYDVDIWQADISKADKLLGWQPKISLREGLYKYITHRWFQEDLG